MYSLTLLFQLIQVFFTANTFSQITEILYNAGLYSEIPSEIWDVLNSVMNGAKTVTIIISLLGLVIPVLIGVGMWMHFAASKKRGSGGMKTSGLTLIKVCTIINFVFVCISLFLVFILLIIILIGAMAASSVAGSYSSNFYGSYGSDVASAVQGILGILLVVYFIIFAVMAVLAILYYVKLIKSINAVSITARTGVPRKVSLFVPVMHFIVVFFGLIGIVFLIFGFSRVSLLSSSYTISTILGIVSSVLNLAVLIPISIAMIKYNSKIQQLTYQAQPQPIPAYNPNNPYPNNY